MTPGIVSSTRGSAMTTIMVFSAFVALASIAIIEVTRQTVTLKQSEAKQLSASHSNEKALTLAGYLITNNLVLCRESGMDPANPNRRCAWAGQMATPPIRESEFNLESASYDENGALLLSLRRSLSILMGTPTKISFQLANYAADPKTRDLIGNIPREAAIADDDWWIVVIEASTEYADGSAQKKILRTVGGVRRPLAAPVLDLEESPFCHFSCNSGVTASPNPDCKSHQKVIEPHKRARVAMRLTNLGPGALLGSVYDKAVEYDPAFFPSMTEPVRAAVDMLEGQTQPLLPLESVQIQDSFDCLTPEVFQGNTVGANNQAYLSLFTYSYEMSVARFNPADPRYVNAETRSAFLAQFDPFNPSTFTPNPTLSKLEPRKAGGTLTDFRSQEVRDPSGEEPPTRRRGDGGGGNN